MDCSNHLYVILQKIDGQNNFYSHWERLHPSSPVVGVVWNEYLGFGKMFPTRLLANMMRSRIIRYDNRTKCRVIAITEEEAKKAKQIVAFLENG